MFRRFERTVLQDSAGCDLEVWTFDQLKQIVGDFKKSKQRDSPVFDLTGTGTGGLDEFDQLQSPTVTVGGPADSRSFAVPDPNPAQTSKFIETKQQFLTNKSQQMKHDLDDIFADLDALKVKKVNDLFNLSGKPHPQAKALPGHFSDFEINDKGEIVLLNSTAAPEPANTSADDRDEPRSAKVAVSGTKQAAEGQKKPERRRRDEIVPKDKPAEPEEEAPDGATRPTVEVVK